MAHQGSLELLTDPVAEAMLESANPARLAYTWTDGSPRVVPIWFHWTGDQFALGSPPKAPKLKALAATRYFGPEQGPAWVSTLRGKPMARIAVTPEWVGILDFQTRFPSALGI